jgi:hypothetical protein
MFPRKITVTLVRGKGELMLLALQSRGGISFGFQNHLFRVPAKS